MTQQNKNFLKRKIILLLNYNSSLQTQISDDLVYFYEQMTKDLSLSSFNEADQRILLQAAKQYLAAGVSRERALTLIIWAQRIKQVFDNSLFQWLFLECGVKNKLTFANLTEISNLLLETVRYDQNNIEQILNPMRQAQLTKLNSDDEITQVIAKLKQQKNAAIGAKFLEKSVEQVVEGFSQPNKDVRVYLSKNELEQIKIDYEKLQKYSKAFVELSVNDLTSAVVLLRKKNNWDHEQQLKLLAIARELIRRTFKIFPYNTQMFTVLALLRAPQKLKGHLAQMRAGEGKSTVVVLLAVLQAMTGKYVDIITSSRYLAERDQKKYAEFFKLFDLTCTHICTDSSTAQNFSGNIVYGTNYDFEFALLRDKLFAEELRILPGLKKQPRPFDVVIIDEVDNMLIDRSLESARMAVSDPNDLSWLYRHIYQFVMQHQSMMNVSAESIMLKLREYLMANVEMKFRDQIPKEDHLLQKWLVSAVQAIYKKEKGRDYVIEVQETVRQGRIVNAPEITIVDYQNTGQLQLKSRWQDGVHEFLEIKEGLTVGQNSLTAAAMSHPVYFSYYKEIFGLTGTMGGEIERREVETVYKVDTFDVPTHLPNKRQYLEPKFFKTKDEYYDFLIQEIKQMRDKKRPILILVRSVNDSIELAKKLKEAKVENQVLNAVQNESGDFIILRAGNPGMTTVATNTAGRGTDIILTQEALQASGLHTLFGFYPANRRIEEQGLARGARQGQPGSARIVVHLEDDEVKKLLSISLVKRDTSLLTAITAKDDKSFFEKLDLLRNEQIELESQYRELHVAIEMQNHRMLTDFFAGLDKWRQSINKEFLTALAKVIQQQLSTRITKLEKKQNKSEFVATLHQRLEALQQSDVTVNDCLKWLESVNIHITEKTLTEKWAQFYTSLHDVMQQTFEETDDVNVSQEVLIKNYIQKTHALFEGVMQKLNMAFTQSREFFKLILKKEFSLDVSASVESTQRKIEVADRDRFTNSSQFNGLLAARRSLFGNPIKIDKDSNSQRLYKTQGSDVKLN